MLRLAAILAALGMAVVGATAVELAPCRVLYVSDGDTIVVATPAAPEAETRVRLKWVDTPEVHDNPHSGEMPEGRTATGYLRGVLPRGSMVKLWSPEAEFERDQLDRVIALVRVADPAAAADAPEARRWPSAQERVIRAGWSVYWRRYGDAPPELHEIFQRDERYAAKRELGVWGSAPAWMETKRAERPPERGR